MDLHPDILHMARVKPLSEKACEMGWGESFSMKSLLCTDAAASTSCLVQSYSRFNDHYSYAHVVVIQFFILYRGTLAHPLRVKKMGSTTL